MAYYDNNESLYQETWDKEYARELYWEAKGMGNANPSNEPVAKPLFPKYPCWKCGRYGTKVALKYHNEKYPDCDK